MMLFCQNNKIAFKIPFNIKNVFCEYRANFGTFVKTPYKTDFLHKLNSTPSATDYVLLSKSCFVTAVILALTSDINEAGRNCAAGLDR